MGYCELDLLSGQPGDCLSFGVDGYGGVDDLSSTTNLNEFWAATHLRTGLDFELVRIDVASQTPTQRTRLNTTSRIVALAIDPTAGQFYGATEESLVLIDSDSGDLQAIAPLTLASTWATMAFDNTGTLYGVADTEESGHQLVKIDKQTAAIEPIGVFDLVRMQGIAFHPTTNNLYGVGFDGEYKLFRIDSLDASASAIGKSHIRQSGLAFVVPEPSVPKWMSLNVLVCLLVRRRLRLCQLTG